jgi:hypothetical protein
MSVLTGHCIRSAGDCGYFSGPLHVQFRATPFLFYFRDWVPAALLLVAYGKPVRSSRNQITARKRGSLHSIGRFLGQRISNPRRRESGRKRFESTPRLVSIDTAPPTVFRLKMDVLRHIQSQLAFACSRACGTNESNRRGGSHRRPVDSHNKVSKMGKD